MKNSLIPTTFVSANSLLRVIFARLVFALVWLPGVALAQGVNVDRMVGRLDQLVHLTIAQKSQAAAIFSAQNDAQRNFPDTDAWLKQGGAIRQKARADLRALLTPTQQTVYDSAPQRLGGGATQDPAAIAARVDQVVNLTEAQRLAVSALYIQQVDDLRALSSDDRAGAPGAAIRRATQTKVREWLTPEQRVKFDANPNGGDGVEIRASLTAYLKASPAVVARVGAVSLVQPKNGEEWIRSLNDVTQSSEGTYTCRVVGAAGELVLTVSWARRGESGAIQVTQIADANGTALALN